MHVVARRVEWGECPPEMAPFTVEAQTFLTVGRKYEVHAVAVFKGFSIVLIVDDQRYPTWKVTWLFDVVDCSVPGDWICNFLHEEPSMLLGPQFVASSEEAYGAMVELEAEQVDRFWKRVASMRQDEDHSDEPS